MRVQKPPTPFSANTFSKNALECMKAYDWPGNVRELRNAVDRALTFCNTSEIDSSDLTLEVRNALSDEKKKDLIGSVSLPDNEEEWARHFAIIQLRMIIEAYQRTGKNGVRTIKLLFPQINSPNKTYLDRLVKKILQGNF